MLKNRQISCQTIFIMGIVLLIGFILGGAALFGWKWLNESREPVAAVTEPAVTVTTDSHTSNEIVEPIKSVSLDPTPAPYWDNVYVEYILDASGSMLEEIEGERKIDVAQDVLSSKAGQLPSTTNVGLRVYGHRIDYNDDKDASCQDIELLVPPVRGGRDRVLEKLSALNALGMTPLTEAVVQSVDDFDYDDPFRHNNLVLISDGEETCGGDPCSMADDLINVYGVNFTMYVIGFDIQDNPTAQAQLQCLSNKTGGVYLEAGNRDELAQALGEIWGTMDQRAEADYENRHELPINAEVTATVQLASTAMPISNGSRSGMFRGNIARTGVYHTKSVERLSALHWKFQTGDAISSSPVVVDGVVYFGSQDSNLYAVDIKTGQEKWKFQTGNEIYSSPAVADGLVYFGSWDGNLYAVDIKTGQEKWKFQTENMIFSSPVVANGIVYFGSGDSNLYAVDIKTGQEKWKFQTESAVPSSPAVANDIVYFGSEDGHLYAVDIKTGQEKWKFQTDGMIFSSPAVVDGIVYVGSQDDNLYAVDIKTGQERWKFWATSWVRSSPAVVGGIIYFGSGDNNLYAVDIKTGQEKWKFQTGDAILFSSPVVADGIVYFGSDDGHL